MKLSKNFVSGVVIAIALITIIGLSGLNYITPSIPTNPEEDNVDPENNNQPQTMAKIYITVSDNAKIAANLYPTQNPSGWIVFNHMMPATKESWDSLAKTFQSLGYEGIAIDLRGHGESEGGPSGYEQFGNADHQKSILDVESAVEYLTLNRGATPDRISLIGASIGANLSLEYLVEHPEFKTVVLLSGGLNYFGIQAQELVGQLKAGQKALFVSARDDERVSNNAEQTQKLYDLTPANIQKQIKIYDAGGHGTSILEKQPELNQLVINFVLTK